MATNEESDPSAILNGFWVTLFFLFYSYDFRNSENSLFKGFVGQGVFPIELRRLMLIFPVWLLNRIIQELSTTAICSPISSIRLIHESRMLLNGLCVSRSSMIMYSSVNLTWWNFPHFSLIVSRNSFLNSFVGRLAFLYRYCMTSLLIICFFRFARLLL